MHEGHRERMLEKLKASESSLNDHELLEIMLFPMIPRKNTNGVAHRLLDAFGSLNGIFLASATELAQVEGIGEKTAAQIRNIGLLYERMRFGKEEQPRKFNIDAYSGFLTQRYAGLSEEVVEVFCLDSSQRIKSCKRFSSGNAERVRVRAEEISAFVAASRADGVVVAHNHPAAGCTPSRADDDFTGKFAVVCSVNNVKFYDHIIVGTNGVYSYFRLGHMDKIRQKYNIDQIVSGNPLL